MSKGLVVGILFKVGAMGMISFPIIAGLVGAAILNHFYGWEWKAFLIILAGIVGTAAMVGALFWVLEDHEPEIREWVASVGKEKIGRPMSYDA